jgi:hypothetical protein
VNEIRSPPSRSPPSFREPAPTHNIGSEKLTLKCCRNPGEGRSKSAFGGVGGDRETFKRGQVTFELDLK